VSEESSQARRERLKQSGIDNPELIPHGTKSGYGWYACRCEPCRQVNSLRKRLYLSSEGAMDVHNRTTLRGHAKAQRATPLDRRWQPWTGPELTYLERNHGSESLRDIATHLGRTYYATARAASRLGL